MYFDRRLIVFYQFKFLLNENEVQCAVKGMRSLMAKIWVIRWLCNLLEVVIDPLSKSLEESIKPSVFIVVEP